jgi:hypothetical protein
VRINDDPSVRKLSGRKLNRDIRQGGTDQEIFGGRGRRPRGAAAWDEDQRPRRGRNERGRPQSQGDGSLMQCSFGVGGYKRSLLCGFCALSLIAGLVIVIVMVVRSIVDSDATQPDGA